VSRQSKKLRGITTELRDRATNTEADPLVSKGDFGESLGGRHAREDTKTVLVSEQAQAPLTAAELREIGIKKVGEDAQSKRAPTREKAPVRKSESISDKSKSPQESRFVLKDNILFIHNSQNLQEAVRLSIDGMNSITDQVKVAIVVDGAIPDTLSDELQDAIREANADRTHLDETERQLVVLNQSGSVAVRVTGQTSQIKSMNTGFINEERGLIKNEDNVFAWSKNGENAINATFRSPLSTRGYETLRHIVVQNDHLQVTRSGGIIAGKAGEENSKVRDADQFKGIAVNSLVLGGSPEVRGEIIASIYDEPVR